MDKNAQNVASLNENVVAQGQTGNDDSQQQAMKNLDDFMEGLLQASGVSEGMPDETKKMMKDEMTRTLLNQIDRAAIDELTEAVPLSTINAGENMVIIPPSRSPSSTIKHNS